MSDLFREDTKTIEVPSGDEYVWEVPTRRFPVERRGRPERAPASEATLVAWDGPTIDDRPLA